MARMIPTKSDTPVSRKMSIKGGQVALTGYTVKMGRDDAQQLQFDKIILNYPGCATVPNWVLEKAARHDWIAVQAYLRKVKQDERLAFEGKILDCSALGELLKTSERTVDPMTKVIRTFAALSPEEQAEFLKNAKISK